MNSSNKKHFFGNILFSFVLLTIIVMIVSFIGNALGWQVAYSKVNSVTGAIEKTIVSVANLFSPAELKIIIGNAMSNFIAFAPVGAFLIATIGIGVAYKSGLLTTIFTIIGRHLNKFWMTYIVALLSIVSSFTGDASFVIIIPLAAILYLSNNRIKNKGCTWLAVILYCFLIFMKLLIWDGNQVTHYRSIFSKDLL